ncbi:zinc ribbon domain-containing protein [Halorubrum ejinorense]|uniref:Zinc ribbon domain-containing protein n=1 Tax=Halorubrum ejinorense TaxID=425309 RepID=A0AAV3SPW4_9EURY
MPSTSDDPQPACPDCGEAVPPDASFCPDCGADLDDASDPAYCADCGEPFAADDRFCSNCGASRSGDAPTASERSDDADSPAPGSSSAREETTGAFRRRVQDHLDAGWEIERDDGERVVLVDRGIGSVGVHILLFIFTSGIGNLLYGWWHYSKLADRRRLVRGDETPVRAPSRSEGGQRTETITAYMMSALLVLIGGFICFFAVQSAAPPAALIGLAFALLGVGSVPPVKRRLGRRHGLTDFGRQKTVDHRVVRPPESVDDPCVVCGEAFDRGLVRRRRDETVVAGVPVRTHSIRHNHYCVDCAQSELFSDPLGADRLADVDSSFGGEEETDREEPPSDRGESASEGEASIPDQEASIPDEPDPTDGEQAVGRNE